jgi:signal transduction histidine kinase
MTSTAVTAVSANMKEPSQEHRVKILLVDDQPENLVALEAVLEGLGQELITANSGMEALRQMLEHDFAAVLLDVKMPDMDGFETAALIRQRERSRDTPILFLTAFRNDEHLYKGYNMGAVDYLQKPIVPDILRSKVCVFVDLKRKADLLKQKNELLEQLIAERLKIEEDIRKLNSELERRVAERTQELSRTNDELRQFAYIASHDLQEPLRTVGSYAQLLAKRYRGKLDNDADDFIHYIVDGVTRMHVLLNDMLAYSRVTDSNARPMGDAHFGRIVENALANLEATIKENDAEITYGELPVIVGDEVQLTQVMQNLVANGIKYRREVPPKISISVDKQNGEWVFSVGDNGIGIDSKYKDRIFGIFKRLHGKELPGTGMGLAICKKIIERHGGRIWVDSTLGEGSVFQFSIPDTNLSVSPG